jgi:hypothetical protein
MPLPHVNSKPGNRDAVAPMPKCEAIGAVARESFTSGLNFFTTESGLMGRTSGPVQLFDVVIIIDRASDPMVMRRCGKERARGIFGFLEHNSYQVSQL